ncbi:hypothetical protein [Deinococcus marmoris]|uniref:Uncharacterized protein n=1 Tax=Deinococcus marmoris TaxID=249408 RepID=A0A1U7NSH1_9DEIO|nr:hypothetical protein [Deinococcus marmoris]OLV15868.1 hypothetical protein BOO71_0013720 [Deinococcus marmoris]
MSEFTDKYENQFMSIELAVYGVYDEHPELTDAQVDAAYEELARRYRAEATAFAFKPGKLDGLRAEVHDAVLPIAEMLVGRPDNILPTEPVSAEEMRQILGRLRSSIKTWQKAGGRQSYLKYISQFLSDSAQDQDD